MRKVSKALSAHPVATLFPDLSPADYAVLKADIRRHGVKVPILVYQGQILDGRHRYRACRELGRPCPMTEWAGGDAWLEVQSRNLVRRHLAKEQIFAIRMLAAQRLPELAAPIQAAKSEAARRRAQGKGQALGVKALAHSRSRGEAADIIGAQVGVSGTTVKRVERLLRLAPDLVTKVALGELSAKKALQQVVVPKAPKKHSPQCLADNELARFDLNAATRRLSELIRAEWKAWPAELRAKFLRVLQLEIRDLLYEHTVAVRQLTAPDSPSHRRTA